jgi:CubicO group peptidase (beta-lactamase class C family)
MTVRHLLTMSSGVGFSEAGSVTEYEWTKAFFDGRLSFAPGDNFAYNSMNSYILAKIVVRRTGLSLTDFINTRIFRPMGITNFFLEKGPEGVEKGGWGVHLSAESWAKLGIMMSVQKMKEAGLVQL